MTEHQFSKLIIDHINRAGRFAYKASDRYRSGVPDIYVTGGIWIESKKMEKKLSYDPRLILRPTQRAFCDKLVRGGDTVWVAACMVNMHFFISSWQASDGLQYYKRDSSTDLASLINKTILC